MRHFARGEKTRRQRGNVAIVAAALIVIVGFLGVAMMTSMRLTGSNTTNHILATQAHYVADAGVEWACKQDSATSGAISFASGTFEVTANGDAWVSVAEANETKRTMECEPEEATPAMATGLEYVLGSRVYDKDDVQFLLTNTSDSGITFDTLKVTWSSPSAYFEEVRISISGGTDYGRVWDHDDESGNYRWGKGQTKDFTRTSSVTLPAHSLATFQLNNFKKYQTGGPDRQMKNTQVTIDFYYGSTHKGQIIVSTYAN